MLHTPVHHHFDLFLEHQHGRFTLFLPVFLAVGMLAYFDLTFEPSLAWSCAALAATVAAVPALWRWAIPRAAALCAASATTGFTLACLATAIAPPFPDLPRHAVTLSGRLAAVEALPEGQRITLAAASLDDAPPLARSVRIRLRTTDAAPLSPGDLVQVRAMLRPPAPPDYPGGRDTQREAFFDGLAAYGFALGPAQRLSPAARGWWQALRTRVAARLMAGLPGPRGAIAATLLTGIGTAIPPRERAAFQDSGLAHLLAVAGLHIGIVMGLVFATTRFGLAAWEHAALYWPTRQIAALAALASGALYLALTGAHVPIMRSFAMACLLTLGVLTGRRAVSLRGLALAAVALLVLSPASVVGVSFQMSFSAVLALIAGYELARPALARLPDGWWRRPLLHGAGLVLTSLLAGTASMPFAAYHFGRATLYYVPANMLAVPLTAAWVMPWGLTSLALMPLGLERIALVPMGWGISMLQAVAHTVAAWPGAVVGVAQMPAWGLALVAAGLAWAGLWRGWLRLAGVAPLLAGLACPLLVHPPDVLVTPQASVIALRVGGHTLVEASATATPFEVQAPGRVWGGTTEPLGGTGPATCTAAACRASIRGRPVVLAQRPDAATCAAALVVSASWLHLPCGATVLDRSTVADGSAEAWVDPDAVRVLTDATARGRRPWVVRARPALPMALTE